MRLPISLHPVVLGVWAVAMGGRESCGPCIGGSYKLALLRMRAALQACKPGGVIALPAVLKRMPGAKRLSATGRPNFAIKAWMKKSDGTR